jgi:hypothetical protein
MASTRHRRVGWTAGFVGASLVCVSTLAQSPPSPDGDTPAAPERSQGRGPREGAGRGPGARDGSRDWLPPQWLKLSKEDRRNRFRELLEWRRERLQQTQQAIDHALKSMDDGIDIDQIVADFPADLRTDARPGFGVGRGPGGPGGPPGAQTEGQPEGDPVLNDPDRLGPSAPTGDEMPAAGGRGPGPGGGRGPGREARGVITNADREAFDEFLGSAAPRIQVLMRELRERDPERADRKVREAMGHMRGLLELREKDRAMYELRLKDIRAGRDALEAALAIVRHDREHADGSDAPGRLELVNELKRTLGIQYEIRGEILAREITRMENELTKRRNELAQRPGGKEGAVDRNVDDLIDRAQKRWPGRPGSAPEDAPPPGG